MWIAPLFIIVKSWKQPKCPSNNERINKMQYVLKMEYFLAIKINKVLMHGATWINLEHITLMKAGSHKDQMFYGSISMKSPESIKTESRLLAA